MELKEAKKYLEHEVEAYENNIEINQLIGGKAGEIQHEVYKAVLQALDNSIPKEKVEEGIESIEDYFDRLNGPDEDIDFIREIKQELLEKINKSVGS